jgi:polyprenyl-phospho-N-acetylgalactosaminyl synthase
MQIHLPQIADKKIFVLIPAYNDVSTIKQVVAELLQQTPFKVLVVDDGSDEPLHLQLQGLPVIYLRHRVNLGQGAALQTGFAYVRRLQPDIIITFDADGQHSVNDLAVLIAPLLNGEADITLGSRFMPAANSNVSFSRRAMLVTARFINYLLSGILLSDAHNGLRAFNVLVLGKITLKENRMAHASEILFEIKRHKLRYQEVPVSIQYTSYSLRKGQKKRDSIKVLFDLLLHKLFE